MSAAELDVLPADRLANGIGVMFDDMRCRVVHAIFPTDEIDLRMSYIAALRAVDEYRAIGPTVTAL